MKKHLVTGNLVKFRSNEVGIIIDNVIIVEDSAYDVSSIDDDLKSKFNSEYDIMIISEMPKGDKSYLLSPKHWKSAIRINRIWVRNDDYTFNIHQNGVRVDLDEITRDDWNDLYDFI